MTTINDLTGAVQTLLVLGVIAVIIIILSKLKKIIPDKEDIAGSTAYVSGKIAESIPDIPYLYQLTDTEKLYVAPSAQANSYIASANTPISGDMESLGVSITGAILLKPLYQVKKSWNSLWD